jgi:hypothetical protein
MAGRPLYHCRPCYNGGPAAEAGCGGDGAAMLNLDDMPEDALFETAKVFEQLARYAHTRIQAIRFRAAGLEGKARSLERECERIYARLPEWAQWEP